MTGSKKVTRAIKRNDIAALTKALDSGVDANAFLKDGATPLIEAVRSGNEPAARLLIKRDATIDGFHKDKTSNPLAVAAMNNDLKFIDLLAENGAALNAVSGDQRTALSAAIAVDKFDAAILLLKLGAKADNSSRTLNKVLASLNSKRSELATRLIEAGAAVNPKDASKTPLQFAAEWNDHAVVRTLIEHGAIPTLAAADAARDPELKKYIESKTPTGMQTLLETAVEAGDAIRATELMGKGARLDLKRHLNTAIRKKSLPLTNLLLEQGAKPRRKDIEAAAASGDFKILNRILDVGTATQKDCKEALDDATDLISTKRLISCAGDITNSEPARLALAHAVLRKDDEAASYLLSKVKNPGNVGLGAFIAHNKTSLVAQMLRTGVPVTRNMIEAAKRRDRPAIAAMFEEAVKQDAENLIKTVKRPLPIIPQALTPTPKQDPVTSLVDTPKYKRSTKNNRFALVVGIEDYKRVPNAQFAKRDAEAVTEHFEALGVPRRNLISLMGDEATKTGLAKYLEEWLPKTVPENGEVYFYWSGHGSPDTTSGDAYLVPWDGDPKFLKTTAYPLSRLYDKLSSLKARRVVVILDACFTGSGGRSVLAKGIRPLVTKFKQPEISERSLTVLTATDHDEITGSLKREAHGLFTYHLLDSLNALGSDNTSVTAKQLFKRLAPRVADDARRDNRSQTPRLYGTDDAVLMESH